MLACIQRVRRAAVFVAGECISRIDHGLLVLVGVAHDDSEADARWLAEKITGLRLFDDDDGKMNRSVAEVGGRLLVVSQFTLLGDCRKGRRPSFGHAAPPEKAEALYQRFIELAEGYGVPVATGAFREHMQIELVNDGPVTLVIDSRRDA